MRYSDYAIIILLILCISSYKYLKSKVRDIDTDKYYEIKNFTDETSNYYFNCISIYLLSCLSLSLNNIVDNFVFVFLMFIVGYIYISNNMVYMNPIINFMGYKVFDATLDSVNTYDRDIKSIIIINKNERIKIGDIITGSIKNGFVYENVRMRQWTLHSSTLSFTYLQFDAIMGYLLVCNRKGTCSKIKLDMNV